MDLRCWDTYKELYVRTASRFGYAISTSVHAANYIKRVHLVIYNLIASLAGIANRIQRRKSFCNNVYLNFGLHL